MSPEERAGILQILVKRHPELESEAEGIAVAMMSLPAIEDIAEEVLDAVTIPETDELYDRAGAHSWGYVAPDEAAYELLEEAVGDFVADMKRRMEVGLDAAAEAICCGIVVGLYKVKGSDGPLGWAPDFPADHAGHVVAELIRSSPAGERATVRGHLAEALFNLVPDWAEMLSRTMDQVVKSKAQTLGSAK